MAQTLEALCGTLLIGGFHGTEVPAFFAEALQRGALGGAILFKRNLTGDPEHVSALNAALAQAASRDAPPLLAVDQEGGRVARIKAPALELPPMLRLASTGDESLVEEAGHVSAAELVALGVTMNFAPVLAVHTNEANPIIGDRAFGTEPERAARFALAFARGMAAGGILACGKHFPGHGDTTTDSHLELPVVAHDRARLDRVELLPFRLAAAAGLPAFMPAHVHYPALDDVPATLSHRIATDLLRGELGYRGVLISDDLEMKAIASRYGYGEAAVLAVAAGCDALLVCSDEAAIGLALDGLVARAEKDATFRARCEQAAGRILAMRRSHAPRPLFGNALHAALATERKTALRRRLAEVLP